MNSALPDIVIRASAGTGKTYQLASRFLTLLDSDVPPESILAATFTRKAAGEILDRILLWLARAAHDEVECAKLRIAMQSSRLTTARCQQLLARMTSRLHRLQVGTLDSFFAKLASTYSLELGLPPGWRILDEVDLKRLRQEAVEALLESADDDDLVRLLRLLTRGTTSRSVNDLILSTVQMCHEVALETDPEAWCKVPRPLMPTKEALEQSRQALNELLTVADKTFAKAIQADLEMADRDQWEEMLKKGILAKLLAGETKYNRKELDASTLSTYRKVLAQASAIALHRLSRQTEATRELLDRFDRELRDLQRRHGGCSFSDVARALAGRRQGGRNDQRAFGNVAFRMDSRLSHLLLDEFQDTSPLQWTVLRSFAEHVMSKKPMPEHQAQLTLFENAELLPSFFCVGDVKQAIYGWRGGDARIFDTLQRQLPEVKPLELSQSWRSASPIIETVNRVFQNLCRHPRLERLSDAIDSWCRAFPVHTTAKTELGGFVQFRTVAQKENGESSNGVTLTAAATLVAELAAKHPTRTIGVLTRSNEAVAQLIFELQRLGVPASEEGGHPLTDSAAVLLVLSLLKLADHPGDTIARFHVATSPLGPAFDFVDFRDDVAAARLAEFLRRRLLCDGYGPCIAAWSAMLSEDASPRDQTRLVQLIQLADAYQPSSTLRPNEFAELVRDERVTDPSGDRIRVMTVHQAKGLQFDIVVLPELDKLIPGQSPALVAGNVNPAEPPDAVCLYRDESIQQLLPRELQQLFEQDIECRTHESLCVLYVALTRAIHAMYLLIAPHDKEPTKSFSGLLRASLANSEIAPAEKILFELGDANWDASLISQRAIPLTSQVGLSSLRAGASHRIDFAPPLPVPTRGLHRETPSHSTARSIVPLSDLLKPRSKAAMERGTLIHKWFEQIEWLEDGMPTTERLLAAAGTLSPLTIDPARVLPEFIGLLSNPTIASLLRCQGSSRGSLTARVLREYSFACRFNRMLTSGVIDRLVLWSSDGELVAADLIDFKTDSISDQQSLAMKVETYRPQLDSYRRAVAQLFDLDETDVTAKLVFVDAGKVIDV